VVPDKVRCFVSRIKVHCTLCCGCDIEAPCPRDDFLEWLQLGNLYLKRGSREQCVHANSDALKYAPDEPRSLNMQKIVLSVQAQSRMEY
jgi:hypothetical protein